MTEAIKQWIEEQLKEDLKNFTPSPSKEYGYKVGLTKGIEIAEGFATFLSSNYNPYATGKWEGDGDTIFTTSQLLELYLKTLEP